MIVVLLQAAAARQIVEHDEHVADLRRHHLGVLQELQLQDAGEVQWLVQEQVGAGMPTGLWRLGTAGHVCSNLPWRLDLPLLVQFWQAVGAAQHERHCMLA